MYKRYVQKSYIEVWLTYVNRGRMFITVAAGLSNFNGCRFPLRL